MKLRSIVIALAIFSAPAASACGGFFCSLNAPVDQAGEQILFAVDGNEVTAHIQIQYQGEAEKFSWVLPMPAVPEFEVGTDILFQRLRDVTNPKFELQWNNPEGCDFSSGCDCAMADGAGGGDDGGGEGGGGVSVVSEGEVGPFVYQVVQSADGDALFTWLNENGYDQPDGTQPLVTHYVNQGYVFATLKLQKGKAAGELQPIIVRYTSDTAACIPLKLTSVAATDDMPVFAWILSDARAVPMNYFHVLLNPKKFDWINCGTSSEVDPWCSWQPYEQECQKAYMDLVGEAADAANGHAFVTEYAGDSSIMKDLVYAPDQFDTDALATQETPGAFLQQMMGQGFPRNALVQEIIKVWIPKPPVETLPENCREDRDFYAIWNIDECIPHMPEDWSFDPTGMAADLQDRIVKPMEDAQALFGSHPYLTRLFTTVSPDEMTKDPIFSFNPDLPEVSNVFTAQASAVCKEGSSWEAEQITITYEDGSTQTYDGDFYQCGGWEGGVALGDDGADLAPEEDAVADIQVLSEAGGPESIAPGDVDAKEAEIDTRVPGGGGGTGGGATGGGIGDDGGDDGTSTGTGTGTDGTRSGDGSGCTAGGSGTPPTGLGLALLMMVAYTARRRFTKIG